jgi:hypothetical protein
VALPYVIVWDLDDTLGNFDALAGTDDDSDVVSVLVRPGMEEALRRLSAEGFVHTVLTLAMPLYAEVALRGTGLRGFFERVDGMGQRSKGDAVGIGNLFGFGEAERAERLLFVGNHPFDAPLDPRVVFHLELCALSRPAEQLTRLVLHLRDRGEGSLLEGFYRLSRPAPWWRKLWPRGMRGSVAPVRCRAPDIGSLMLLARPDECPVIGFEKPPREAALPTEHRILPGEVAAQVRAEREKL